MTVDEFARREEQLLMLIHDKLKREERNLGYSRWANDLVILVRSERAAHRVMKGTMLP